MLGFARHGKPGYGNRGCFCLSDSDVAGMKQDVGLLLELPRRLL
jgi:hypothetical protein